MDDSARPTKPVCLRNDALAVLKQLREGGHIAYFAGGCVRDLLLGNDPKDFDVATDAPPQRVRELFRNTQAVGQAFGVILVRQGRSIVEVATFRSDGRYLDGRHPQSVRFTSPQEDARRRDFTINGLFLDPLSDQVIDYVGGQKDLAARLLRAIGRPEQRFEEDHLRLLRAVRFASRFDFTIEPATAAAITHHAPQLARISPERIAEELRLILTAPSRCIAWPMLWEYGLIGVIFRFLPDAHLPIAKVTLDPDRSLFLKIDPTHSISLSLALAAAVFCFQWHHLGFACDPRPLLGRDAAAAARRALRKALKISNEDSDTLARILESTGLLLRDTLPSLAGQKRFVAASWSPQTRLFLDALRQTGWFEERIRLLQDEFARLDKIDCAPPPLITGDDLSAAGLRPGPIFKKILDAVYDAQLEGRVATREQAMRMALGMAT